MQYPVMIEVTISESFINDGVNIPYDFTYVSVSEGRIKLQEGLDYLVEHYKLYFSDEFLNMCSMGDTIKIWVYK